MENKQLQLVTFEQAQRLKKAGFDLETIDFYKVQDGKLHNWGIQYTLNHNDGRNPNYISAPTVALALKWMRDVKEIDMGIFYERPHVEYQGYATLSDESFIETGWQPTYESAESALLDGLTADAKRYKNDVAEGLQREKIAKKIIEDKRAEIEQLLKKQSK